MLQRPPLGRSRLYADYRSGPATSTKSAPNDASMVDPARIGLRYPVEFGLAGHNRKTIQALLPLVQHNPDRIFLSRPRTR